MYIHILCAHIIYDLLNGNANSTELLSMAGFYTKYVLYTASVSLVPKKKNRCMSIVHVRFRNYLQPYIGFLKLIISSIADVTIILFQVYTYTN